VSASQQPVGYAAKERYPKQEKRGDPARVPQEKPFRLIYITASMPFGPGEQFLVPEAHELIRRGYDVLIVPRSPKGAVFNRDALGLDRDSLRQPLFGPFVLFSAALEFLRHPITATNAFAALFGNKDVRVLAKNAAVFPKALWLARVARRWRADHIHAHWGRTTATMALIASQMTGIPWSLTLHSEDIAEPNLLATKLDRATFARFISRSGLHIALSLGAVGHSAKVCVIHMGVALPDQLPVPTADNSTFMVLCPGYLCSIKGHEYLIRAMAILRDRGLRCSLRIAGGGELLKGLQEQADMLDLGSTTSFLGQVPHDRIMSWYKDHQIDAVVLPSIDLGNHIQEGIPVALMEAMAYGVPVVSTETGGIPELLGEGAGILVPQRNPEALAAALEALIRDPGLRFRLGLAGRQRIEEQFSVETTTNELAAFVSADCRIGGD
jgi:colanic acid/amylovoran biosynthesis glycosyltransferase